MDITVSIYTEEKKTITYLIKKYKCHKYLKILIIFCGTKTVWVEIGIIVFLDVFS